MSEIATYDEPWAADFLGDTGVLAVTERRGRLLLRSRGGERTIEVSDLPEVAYGGQGGLGDVVAGHGYDGVTNRRIYLSWAEAGPSGTGGATSGGVVGSADLLVAADGASARLDGLRVIWRQEPKVTGQGHYSHRIAVSPDGRYLFVSSGERQKMEPAQDLDNTLGTIVRLTPDGAPAPGNPFASRGGASAQIWSYGHRNVLGLAFDADGRLWATEMGPRGGDELNLIEKGANYGWPTASNGSHYDGRDIPDHRAGDGFAAPKLWWNPSISPGGLMIYSGSLFTWTGDALVPALSGSGLLRLPLAGTRAEKADYWDLGFRVREVEQGPDGSIYLLQDGPDGRLLRLTPR
ncbi:MAG: PQQ-dependent sugar dehydrogenase [Micrococcales bacterium]|nr:PQQ-dependent sugar dehydrogenase [Micrococcales bacterium]